MRRDWDTCRRILAAVADSPDGLGIDQLTTEADGRRKVGEHIRLLDEAGLVRATIRAAGSDPFYYCHVSRLTWAGQDWLAAVEGPGVWDRVKERVRTLGGSVALDTLKAVALAVASEMLGL